MLLVRIPPIGRVYIPIRHDWRITMSSAATYCLAAQAIETSRGPDSVIVSPIYFIAITADVLERWCILTSFSIFLQYFRYRKQARFNVLELQYRAEASFLPIQSPGERRPVSKDYKRFDSIIDLSLRNFYFG